MISVLLSRLVLLVFGTLYPAYASYKTVKTKNVRDYVKWMMYWIVFALYTFIEVFTDIFVAFWCPFYYEMKILFVFWLICPATKGSTYIFRKVINPYLTQHEELLDAYISSLWNHGYDVLRTFGAQGLDYLVHFFFNLLHKGQRTAANCVPNTHETVPDGSTIRNLANNASGKKVSDDEDFDILMLDCVESNPSVNVQKQSHCLEMKDSDSSSEEILVHQRPLKISKMKTKGAKKREEKEERNLRQRKKRDAS